jgi:hypothetical protein
MSHFLRSPVRAAGYAFVLLAPRVTPCVHLRPSPLAMGALELSRVREIALALPEVNERVSHGAPCFFIRNTTPLCYFHDNHRGDGRTTLWCPVGEATQQALIAAEPQRFSKPVTSSAGAFNGWLVVSLESPASASVDWHQISVLLGEVYRNVAPKALVMRLGDE